MKKIVRILMLCLALGTFAVAKSAAQEVIVGARLADHPREVRPARPSPGHVWVGGEWAPSGGTYTWRAGYWALPPRHGGVWVAGHWRHRPGGWAWVPGHWA
jgi:hypothetical protein